MSGSNAKLVQSRTRAIPASLSDTLPSRARIIALTFLINELNSLEIVASARAREKETERKGELCDSNFCTHRPQQLSDRTVTNNGIDCPAN